MNKSFGKTISYLRKEKGISQKEASEDLGISQSLLSHYEKGIRECSLEFVVKLADYYNVSCDYLLGRSAERNHTQISISNEGNKAMLENLNSKVIINNVEFIYRILTEINQRDITKNTSEILMVELYSIIRNLFKINPENNEEFFATSNNNFDLQCNSISQIKKYRLKEKINELANNKKFNNKIQLSYNIISQDYSDISSSVFNLIHNAEKQLKR